MPPPESPAQRYAKETRTEEIGATRGQKHDDVLQRTLGRERGLRVATGLASWEPMVVGDARDEEDNTLAKPAGPSEERAEP